MIEQATELFKRANLLSLRHKETTLEARAEVVSQTKNFEGTTANAGLGAGTDISAPSSPVSTDKAESRESIRDYGKGVPAVQEREAAIRLSLDDYGFPLTEMDIADVLIRQLAAQQCLTLFERTYRMIFGSQILAMELINTQGPQSSHNLCSTFYETAKALYPDFYGTYPCESWLSFLTRYEMVQKIEGSDQFILTVPGKDFLVWLVNNGLTREKAG